MSTYIKPAISVLLLAGVVAVAGVVGVAPTLAQGQEDKDLPAAVALERSNQAISDRIKKELFLDPFVSSGDVSVDTTAGIVTLRGTVRTLLSKGRAAWLAENTPGVVAVINDLKVAPSRLPLDREIRSAVTSALLRANTSAFSGIDVRVDTGVVFLSGTVSRGRLRDQATRVAEAVPGVVAVRNDLRATSAAAPPDAEICSAIREAFRRDAFLDPAAIQVEVRNGRVRFTGTAASPAERVEAVRAAWAAGATSVDGSQLAVAAPAPRKTTPRTPDERFIDEDIQSAVDSALIGDERVNTRPIRAEVKDRVVTLRGAADSPAAKQAAGHDARRVYAVRDVVNQLRVEPPQKIYDQMIYEQLIARLRRDPVLGSSNLAAQVSEGVVRLSGTVRSEAQRKRAVELASKLLGVVKVRNELVVQPPRTAGRPQPPTG